MDRVEALLTGPRGRRLCHELLAAHPLLTRAEPPFGPVDPAEARQRLIHRVADTDLAAATTRGARAALADAVAHARYWQEPDGIDELLAFEMVADSLARVAGALATDPDTQWWWEPLERVHQVAVDLVLDGGLRDRAWNRAGLTSWRADTQSEEERAREERPDDPSAAWSGWWWSTPSGCGLWVTTRATTQPPPGVDLVEDELGWTQAHVRPARPYAAARVFEIDEPAAWSELVQRYPLPVPYSRRHDWFRTTGSDRHWLIPDYLAASADWDAIHLSVAGYLTTAGAAVPAGDGWSVLAGWSPDETWWLTDSVTVDASTEEWTLDENTRQWTCQPPAT